MTTYDPIHEKMLAAVDELASNEGKTNSELTKQFWDAFEPFAEVFLTGTIDINTDGTNILIKFKP